MKDKITEAGDNSEIVRGNLKVAWTNLGEGYIGDYDEDDPKDVNFLRFDALEKKDGEWEPVEDGSYCTLFPARATQRQKTAALRLLIDQLYDAWQRGSDFKHTAERLSWIEPSWLDKLFWQRLGEVAAAKHSKPVKSMKEVNA